MARALELDPYAARVCWSAGTPLASDEWRALLVAFADEVARRAVEAGAAVIGHVKAIARPEAGGYLHVSAVSAAHPASARGEVPDGLRELRIDLNVLVYGLPRQSLAPLVEEAARVVGGSKKCSASVEATESHAHFHELHSAENAR